MALLWAGGCAGQVFTNITGPGNNPCEGASIGGSIPLSVAGQFTPQATYLATGAGLVVFATGEAGTDGSFSPAIYSDAGGLPGLPLVQTYCRPERRIGSR
jgi:hypothetical protein